MSGNANPSDGDPPQAPGATPEHGRVVPTADEANHWRANLKVLLPLLVAWFLVSYGAGILFVDTLNQFHVPFTSVPLGMWFAQQGSIYAFVLIIYAYVLLMNLLDRTLGVDEHDG